MKKVIGFAILLPLLFAGIYRVWFIRNHEPQPPVEILGNPIGSTPARTERSPDARGQPPAQSPSSPAPSRPPVEAPAAGLSPAISDTATPPATLYTRFENEAIDPQWSQEHEIMIETFLFGSPGYVDLDIESISCKSTLCEIKVSERDNTVWAKVAHDLAREQGWESTSWKYADYYDSNGKRIIHAVVGKSRPDQ